MAHDKSFGKTHSYYRDERLGITQTAYAKALSDSNLYKITAQDVANWEANRNLEQIDKSLYSVIEATLVEQAKLTGWSDDDIHAMKSELSDAYSKRLQHQNSESDNPFSEKLRGYREKLGMTKEQFFKALAEEVLSRDYIAEVEAGAKPSLRFILASAEYFANPGEGKSPVITNDFDRADYVKSGMQQRESTSHEPIMPSEETNNKRPNQQVASAFGRWLYDYHTQKGWKQRKLCNELAKKLNRDGIDVSTVSKVINGQRMTVPDWLIEGASKLDGADKSVEELMRLAAQKVTFTKTTNTGHWQ